MQKNKKNLENKLLKNSKFLFLKSIIIRVITEMLSIISEINGPVIKLKGSKRLR